MAQIDFTPIDDQTAASVAPSIVGAQVGITPKIDFTPITSAPQAAGPTPSPVKIDFTPAPEPYKPPATLTGRAAAWDAQQHRAFGDYKSPSIGEMTKELPGNIAQKFDEGVKGITEGIPADAKASAAAYEKGDVLGGLYNDAKVGMRIIGAPFGAPMAALTGAAKTYLTDPAVKAGALSKPAGDIASDVIPFAGGMVKGGVELGKAGLGLLKGGEKVAAPAAEAAGVGASKAADIKPEMSSQPAGGALPVQLIDPAKTGDSLPAVLGTDVQKGSRVFGAPSPDVKTPSVDGKDFPRDLSDALYQLQTNKVADRVEVIQDARSLPSDFSKTERENVYHFMENPNGEPLTNRERELYDTYVKPEKEEAGRLFNELKGKGYFEQNENLDEYVHRIAKGHDHPFDAIGGDEEADPSSSSMGRGLSKNAPATRARKYFVLEAPVKEPTTPTIGGTRESDLARPNQSQPREGQRMVVRQEKDGLYDMQGNKLEAQATHPDGKISLGREVEIDGNKYVFKNARTKEIEAHTGDMYHKDAYANTMDSLVQMRAAERNSQFLDKLKEDPRFSQFAVKDGIGINSPRGYRPVDIPQLHGYRFDPKIADILEDWKGRFTDGADPLRFIEGVNRIANRGFFIMPQGHMLNATYDAFVGRGLDNYTLNGIANVGNTYPKALSSVINQDARYLELLRKGAPFQQAANSTRDFQKIVFGQVLKDLEANPGTWDQIAKYSRYRTAKDLGAAWMNKSSDILWTYSDALLQGRIEELVQKGMSDEEAIRDATEHIASYRMPSQVLNSRTAANFFRSPLLQFSRYKYHKISSFAKSITGIVSKDPKQRADAAASLLNIAVLGVATEMVQDGINAAFGTNFKFSPFGMPGMVTGMAKSAYRAFEADNPMGVARATVPTLGLNPIFQSAADLTYNKNRFTGRRIYNPKGNNQLEDVGGYLAEQYPPVAQGADIASMMSGNSK